MDKVYLNCSKCQVTGRLCTYWPYIAISVYNYGTYYNYTLMDNVILYRYG